MLRLLRMQLRRDRIILPIWIAATGLMAFASARGVPVEAPTDAAREQILKLAVATPSLVALRGIPDGPSLGSYVYFQVFCYLAILAALMTTFLVSRHARADEERGRLELVGAAPLRRSAPLLATLTLGVLANAVLGVVVALALIGGNLDPSGSWAAGLATASVGIAFLGIGALVSQLAPTSRMANGISGALVGAAFLLRAVGDATGTIRADGLSITSAWPSWLSPIGWGQQVFAFTQQNLAPLLLALGLAVVTAVAALVIQSRRDVGSSLLREREGRASGSPRLRSSLALAWRQQWPSILAWSIGALLLGASTGSLATRFADSAGVSGSIQNILVAYTGGTGSVIDLLVVAFLGIAGVLGAAAGVQSIIRARGEESDGRLELILAAPQSRVRWMLGYLLVAVVAVMTVALAAGLAAGLSFLPVDADRFWSSVAAGTVQIPAGLAFTALTALVFAVLPRMTVWFGWLLLAVGLLIGQFGGLMQLPEWLRKASPFAHTPVVPGPDPDWTGAAVVTVVSLAILAISVLLVRRRELTS